MSEFAHEAATVRGYIGTVNKLRRKVGEIDDYLDTRGLIDRWQVHEAENALDEASQALDRLARYLTD